MSSKIIIFSFIALVVFCLGLLAIVVFSFGLGFGLGSYQNVPVEFYALDFDKINSYVDTTKVYEQGRYNTGISHVFILFPRILMLVEFSVASSSSIDIRTNNGVTITLDISFQYRFSKTNVAAVFNLFGSDYNNIIQKESRDVIRNSASQYSSDQFITNRTTIGIQFNNDVKQKLFDIAFAEVYNVQMRNVRLPAFLETALSDSETKKQLFVQAENNRNLLLFQTETENQVAKRNADTQTVIANTAAAVTIIQANAAAQSSLINAIVQSQINNIKTATLANNTITLAQATASKSVLETQGLAQGLGIVKSSLNFNNTELLTFQWIKGNSADNGQGFNSSSILYNLQQPSTLIKV